MAILKFGNDVLSYQGELLSTDPVVPEFAGYWKHKDTGVITELKIENGLQDGFGVNAEDKIFFSTSEASERWDTLSCSELKLPEGVQLLTGAGMSVGRFDNIQIMDYPSTIENFGTSFLHGLTMVTHLICRAANPPGVLAFGNPQSPDLLIYVPEEYIDVYKQDEFWGPFSDLILPIP